MKIKQSSWHFGLVSSFFTSIEYEHNVSLCKYFWMLVFSILVSAVLGVFLCFILTAFITFLTYPIWQFVLGSNIVVGFSSLLVWIVFGKALQEEFGDSTANWNINVLPHVYTGRTNKKVKEPNVLIEYLKAKKNKVCPLLEIE